MGKFGSQTWVGFELRMDCKFRDWVACSEWVAHPEWLAGFERDIFLKSCDVACRPGRVASIEWIAGFECNRIK